MQTNRRTALKILGGAAMTAGVLPALSLPASAQGEDLVVPNRYQNFKRGTIHSLHPERRIFNIVWEDLGRVKMRAADLVTNYNSLKVGNIVDVQWYDYLDFLVAKKSPQEIEKWHENYLLKLMDLSAELNVKVMPMFWGVAFGWELATGYPWGFWAGGGFDLLAEGKERFVKKTAKLRKHGLQVALVANGDRAVEAVFRRLAATSDGRIAHSHTKVPGPDGKRGWGGSCLGKDLDMLIGAFDGRGKGWTDKGKGCAPVLEAVKLRNIWDRNGE